MSRENSLKKLILNIKEGNSIIRSQNEHMSTVDEVGTFGSDRVDRAAQGSAVELAIRYHESRGEHAQKVAAAVQRINLGTYGLCVECFAKIPLERLKALPLAECCVVHQDKYDSNKSVRESVDYESKWSRVGETPNEDLGPHDFRGSS